MRGETGGQTFPRKAPSFLPQENQDLASVVKRIQEGDEELRNQFITDYQPFISKVVSNVCKRYIDPSIDDEFSIGLMAFDEALQKYTENKGSSFLSFADLVIRRRVIDFVRKEARQSMPYLTDPQEEEEREQSRVEVAASIHQHELDREAEQRREEILHYQERLHDFGISFQELPKYTPKHVDARENALSISKMIADQPDLKKFLLEHGKLPIKPLLGKVEVSRKTLERNRKYIIAMSLIFIEDYVYLKSYLSSMLGSEKGVGDE